jgi:hypothetical protein
MSDDELPIWMVYDHPRDYPNGYIAREILMDIVDDRVKTRRTGEIITAPTLDEIREAMERRGLTYLRRLPDDAVAVETWI